jgi:hypothetical protein
MEPPTPHLDRASYGGASGARHSDGQFFACRTGQTLRLECNVLEAVSYVRHEVMIQSFEISMNEGWDL